MDTVEQVLASKTGLKAGMIASLVGSQMSVSSAILAISIALDVHKVSSKPVQAGKGQRASLAPIILMREK